MVFTLDCISEIGVQDRSNLCCFICLRHFIRLRAGTTRIFCLKRPISFMQAHEVLSYQYIYNCHAQKKNFYLFFISLSKYLSTYAFISIFNHALPPRACGLIWLRGHFGFCPPSSPMNGSFLFIKKFRFHALIRNNCIITM